MSAGSWYSDTPDHVPGVAALNSSVPPPLMKPAAPEVPVKMIVKPELTPGVVRVPFKTILPPPLISNTVPGDAVLMVVVPDGMVRFPEIVMQAAPPGFSVVPPVVGEPIVEQPVGGLLA